MRRAFTLLDRQRARVRVRVPVTARVETDVAAASVRTPLPPARDIRLAPLLARIDDLGTWLRTETGPDKNARNEYFEFPLERGPTILPGHYRNDATLLVARHARTHMLYSGREVSTLWPLQVDADTFQTGTLFRVVGERQDRLIAVGVPTEECRQRASLDEQAAAIAAYHALRRGGRVALSGALGEWAERVAQQRIEIWGPASAPRVGRDAEIVARVAPGLAGVGIGSEWYYEPFQIGDYHRCKLTSVPLYDAPDVPHETVLLNRRRVRDIRIAAAPQRHNLVTRWLDVYLVGAGWWSTILYFPTLRQFSLRAGFWPEIWRPSGAPVDQATVGVAMSTRISRTLAYASAIREGAALGSFFFLVGRVQGEYKIYQRSLDARALCGVIDVDARHSGSPPERYYAWRRVSIPRDRVPLDNNGLHTQEVQPWTPYYFHESSRWHTTTRGELI